MFVTNNENKNRKTVSKEKKRICEHHDSSISVLMTVLKKSRLTSYELVSFNVAIDALF
jgi:hypothetical protein